MTEERNREKTWSLNWGIHRGTLMSRDEGEPIKGLVSLEECRRRAEELQEELARSGIFIWYITATSEDGAKHSFHDLTQPYSR